MPKRTRSDHAEIVALYKKLGSGREVARATGLHENTIYTVLVRARGECRCGQPLEPGYQSCKTCREKVSARTKRKRTSRRRLGLCFMCNDPYELPSRTFCSKHRIQNNARERAKNSKKRGSPATGIPSQRQKERALRSRYGEAAVDLWRERNGTCELCSASHSEKAIHLHHIDEDHKNGARENLALLCFRCHGLVHTITRHPSFHAVLTWIETRYAFMPMCGWPRS